MTDGQRAKPGESLFPSRERFEPIPDAVRATGVRALRELHEIVEGTRELRADPGREWLRSICVLFDHYQQALLTLDSMLSAGASPGTLRAIIEGALAGAVEKSAGPGTQE